MGYKTDCSFSIFAATILTEPEDMPFHGDKGFSKLGWK
jgi:hypothetical protein